MKTLNFDFENIGGVGKLYAIPLSSFLRIREDYVLDKHYLEVKNRTDIIEIPVYCDDSFSFFEDSSNTDQGDVYTPQVSGVIPKLTGDNARLIERLERGYWLVCSQDKNGVVRLSGDPDIPILLKFTTKKHTGTLSAERNGIDFTFSCTQPNPSIYIEIEDLYIL